MNEGLGAGWRGRSSAPGLQPCRAVPLPPLSHKGLRGQRQSPLCSPPPQHKQAPLWGQQHLPRRPWVSRGAGRSAAAHAAEGAAGTSGARGHRLWLPQPLEKPPCTSRALLPDKRVQDRWGWGARDPQGGRGGGRAGASQRPPPARPSGSPPSRPVGAHRPRTQQPPACHGSSGAGRARRAQRDAASTGTAPWGTLTREQSQLSLAPAAHRPRRAPPVQPLRFARRGSHQTGPSKGRVICPHPCRLREQLCSAFPSPTPPPPAPRGRGDSGQPQVPTAMPPEHRPPEGLRGGHPAKARPVKAPQLVSAGTCPRTSRETESCSLGGLDWRSGKLRRLGGPGRGPQRGGRLSPSTEASWARLEAATARPATEPGPETASSLPPCLSPPGVSGLLHPHPSFEDSVLPPQ